jgi:hypothetical protein
MLTVMLWTLLTLTSSVTLIASAVLSAKHARAGFGGYALAITIGLLLGVCNALAVYKLGEAVAGRSTAYSQSLGRWRFRALYFAAALWIPFVAFLGDWAAATAMRLVL